MHRTDTMTSKIACISKVKKGNKKIKENIFHKTNNMVLWYVAIPGTVNQEFVYEKVSLIPFSIIWKTIPAFSAALAGAN